MAALAVDADGDTPMPTTEVDATGDEEGAAQTITDDQHRAMKDVLEYVYDYRTAEGHDPSKLFHKRVNKRFLPDYYEVIKEPQAMSNIRQQLRKYNTVEEYVRDWALICHNAQLYNRPDAGAYHDALTVKALVETELKKLVDSGVFTAEQVAFPFLGDIPHADEIVVDEGAADDEAGKRKGRGKARKQGTDGEKDEAARIAEIEARKKRGRPPRVDTPTEARIKNVLKAMRRSKNTDGQYRIISFDRLPDKTAMPGYYAEIANPMAVDVLKKKLKRKKYASVEQFMQDVELMFENAKRFNEDESQIYKDAVALHSEARKLAAEEQNKPDTDYVMDEGRIPIPEGILHNGELYRVGDWVHIQNANDLTKPIVTQIYRTWKDAAGQKFVNVCWYYRPEQTVHRFDKYFFTNEVVKTGQYRDHSIEEIVNRCFVMFITRYNKGRPRGYPTDKEIYVCESRYNEEKLTFNKIKTWASCLPDEVRDKDYEMELYQEPKKMKKFPSPIAYLLKDTQKESDDLPKPEWGADNAPPKIGAVHKRPRDPRV
jgi:chromatin structure-remodeling complex subunit RSC1/2